jgi:hypothetical protein
VSRIPNEWRMVIVLGGLAAILAAVSFYGGRASGAVLVTHTRVQHTTLAQEYGKPSQSVDGAQINPNLTGFTCDVYQAKQAIICHRA